uniref:Uncharacterized protein n=1 Tax=Caenorhabditis japonica TaxID=281687 RepID=A0A8R1E4V7_CAEJA
MITPSPTDADTDDLRTAIEKDDPTQMQRAVRIRIKQRYNCPEQFITQMRAPFLGFSAIVRFQSRARMHTIKIIKADAIEKVLTGSPVPYS